LLSYALKRIVRSWKLFAALILGMMLAAMFFGGINVGADSIGKQALDQQLQSTPVDMKLSTRQLNCYGFCPARSRIPSTSTVQSLRSAVDGISGVAKTEIVGFAERPLGYKTNQTSIWALGDSSQLYAHMPINGARPSLPNQTLVTTGSALANTAKIGDTVHYNITIFPNSYRNVTYSVSLKIVGFVSFDTIAQNTLFKNTPGPYSYGTQPTYGPTQDVLFVSWENTYARFLDWAAVQTSPILPPGYYSYNGWEVTVYDNVYLDRASLISPFDLEGSASKIQQTEARVSNTASTYSFSSADYLLGPVSSIAPTIAAMRVAFIIVSLPVFFMSWYVGRTVSQSSFNLRRREIGLLMTKGFSRFQLFRHFLTEALFVGIIAAAAGLALVIILNPIFVQALGGTFPTSLYFSQDTAIITIIFTVFLTILAIALPARQASEMDPARALKQYLYVEDTKTRRQRGAIIAFSLGLYKIVLLTLGINYLTLGRTIASGSFALSLIFLVLAVLDFGLTFIGPFLFLYGAAMLSKGLAFRFHTLLSKMSQRIVGDIASLASKSVFRNPRRAAGLVFLVALIMGYSLWIIGDIASMQDYNYRQGQTRVGSDLRLSNIGNNASLIANELRAWSNVTGATPEMQFTVVIPGLFSNSIVLRGIDPGTWRQAASYEPEWFTGGTNMDGLFQQLATNNNTVILDHGVASYLSLTLGSTVVIQNSSQNTLSLRLIGFFGPDYSHQSGPGFGFNQGFFPQGWSYIPLPLINQYPSFFHTTTNTTLVKAASGVSLSNLSSSINRKYPSAIIETTQVSNNDPTAIISNGVLNVLRLGTVFAAAAACIGLGAVTYTGFKEREKETTMISVRGLSYRGLLGLLLTEIVPLVIFGLILGIVVGLITVRGDAMAASLQSFSVNFYDLLSPRRVVFPVWSQLQLGAIIGLLLLGVFLPVILAARKNLSKMSRSVRFA
jgi:ABC-type lipoprotein release transport system permease subunit